MRTSLLALFTFVSSTLAIPAASPQGPSAQVLPVGRPKATSKAGACSSAPDGMQKVMWWTTGPPAGSAQAASPSVAEAAVQKTIESVRREVEEAGGQVASTINIGKMKGLSIVAPSSMVAQMAEKGKELGFKMELDGCAHTMGTGNSS